MNKWMKQGMMGLAISTVSIVGASAAKNQNFSSEPATVLEQDSSGMIDAMDFAGGSKLKDRMMAATEASDVEIVIAIYGARNA